ncbi:hypothetical protein JKP88DRAFT_347358 [Tribonema minus]|uniref:Uncharacterized protein n=1 Tax=Tribonema minus TaxID=303371 RepID=A0A835ZF33_9STRA|nr:hypothetical protein JKP88DRAFT_347358 [Tribonema minus]
MAAGASSSHLVIGLGALLQRSLTFAPPQGFQPGAVNTATVAEQSAGGQGQELAAALASLCSDVKLVQLVGGKSGQALCDALSLRHANIELLSTWTESPTRARYMLLDQRWGERTTVLEPDSTQISGAEQASLAQQVVQSTADTELASLSIMGDLPAGLSHDIYGQLLEGVLQGSKMGDVPVMLGSVAGAAAALNTGHDSLRIAAVRLFRLYPCSDHKMDASDLLRLANIDETLACTWMEDSLRIAAARLFRLYPRLPWIAATHGMLPPVLFDRERYGEGEGKGEAAPAGAKGTRVSAFYRYHARIPDPGAAGVARLSAALLAAWASGRSVPDAFEAALVGVCGGEEGCVRCELVDCGGDDKGWDTLVGGGGGVSLGAPLLPDAEKMRPAQSSGSDDKGWDTL